MLKCNKEQCVKTEKQERDEVMRRKKRIALFLAVCLIGGVFQPQNIAHANKETKKEDKTNAVIEAEEGREKLNFNQDGNLLEEIFRKQLKWIIPWMNWNVGRM